MKINLKIVRDDYGKNPIIGKDLLKLRYRNKLIETYKIEMY